MLIRSQLERIWTNFQLEEPYSLTAYYAHYAESERMWTPSEKLAELPRKCLIQPPSDYANVPMTTLRTDITPEDVQVFAREFFARMYIETLVHGNMDSEVRPEPVNFDPC